MHKSNFSINKERVDGGETNFTLAAEYSEWLFSQKFWDSANEVFGTFFGQYEEEYISGFLAADISRLLKIKIESLSMVRDEFIKFRYAWNEQNEPLYCSVRTGVLVADLTRLADFLASAALPDVVVCCQL